MARRGHPLPTLPHQGANLRFAGGGRIRDARLLFPRPLRADRPTSRWGRAGAGVAVLQAATLQPAGPGRGSLSMAEIKTEVLIAGGGMVGMATAIGLAQAGIACVLVDAQSSAERVSTGYDGRSSAIAYGSQQALMSLGSGRAWRTRPSRSSTFVSPTAGRVSPRHRFSCITTIWSRAWTRPSAPSSRTAPSAAHCWRDW